MNDVEAIVSKILTMQHSEMIDKEPERIMEFAVEYVGRNPNPILLEETDYARGGIHMKQKVLLMGGTGLVGRAIKESLSQAYDVVITAGHHEVEGGYQLQITDTEKLLEILERENPEIVISSLRGDFQAQYNFHVKLADWLSGKNKRLLFISTANVFDRDMSQPWTEEAQPSPESDYGKYKSDCEAMLTEKLSKQLIIFRLPSVWAPDCPRIQMLREYSTSRKPLSTYPNDYVNVTLSSQVGAYAEYVLTHDLKGIFHVGSTDMVDYYEFQKMVCDLLQIQYPAFALEDIPEKVYQAVIPARTEIPDALQITVMQVLETLGGRVIR